MGAPTGVEDPSGAGDERNDADRWLSLGAFIRGQRREAEVSMRRLAEASGVSNPYLSQIERGLRRPSAEILKQLARALSISAETLYVQAGILDEGPRGAVEEAIERDPLLRPAARAELLAVYHRLRTDPEDAESSTHS